MTIAEFETKLNELLTNDTSAFMGAVQLTVNEQAELRRAFRQLPEADRARALELARAKGVDVKDWA